MLSIIIVNWNVRDLLRECLQSIEAGRDGLSLEIIVVDSASSDDSAAMIQSEFPSVRLIACTENVGFPRGNNIGLREARGDYLLLLNPDTVVLGDALEVLVSYLQANPDVGAVGPQLLNPDGSVQSSRRRFPTAATGFFESTWLEGLAPFDASPQRYAHNRTGEDNADAHMKRQIMGREVVIAVTAGRLDFGPWEQVFYGEFDGRRAKRVLVKIIGE